MSRNSLTPSLRDQQIFTSYHVSGKTQEQLAGDYGLTQCRISQIIRRVAAWRSQADPEEEGDLSASQQQRLDRWLEHQRLETVIRLALCHFHQEQRTINTTKTTDRGEKSFTEQIRRELPASVQWLKTALRAIEQLSCLPDQPELPDQELSQRRRESILYEELRRLRLEAEEEGFVAPAADPDRLIDRCLESLTGYSRIGTLRVPSTPEGNQAVQRTKCDQQPQAAKTSSSKDEAPAEPDTYSHTPSDHSPTPTSTTTDFAPQSSQHPAVKPFTSPVAQQKNAPQLSTPTRTASEADPTPRLSEEKLPLDDFGYHPPPPPTTADTRAQIQAYFAKLRAEQFANSA